MNMVCSMLSDKNMPKTFWPEAVNCTIYVLNRCPTLAVKDVTPEEAWSGVKPSVDHFRVFGCIAHVHVPEVRRTKLDNRSITCVLLGVSEESKGYWLYDPVTRRVVISRDVIFEEDRQWDWDVSYEEQLLTDLEWGDVENGTDEEDGTEGEESDETVVGEGEGAEVADNDEVQAVGNELSNVEGSNARGERVRKSPIWMNDYVSGEGLSEEENEVNMALVVSTDPISYEEAVKSSNGEWQWTQRSIQLRRIRLGNSQIYRLVPRR